MRKSIQGSLLVAVFIAACGGEAPPPQAPPPPPPPTAAPALPPAEPAPAAPEPPKPSLLDLQKQTAQTSLAAMNAHDIKKFSECFTSDATLTIYGLGEVKGREAIAADMQKLFEAFPDFKLGISKSYVKGDVLIHEWVMNGTHKAEFMGVKPTSKPVGVRGVTVLWTTPEGLVKQEHRYFDASTMLAQLGHGKAPARSVATLPTGDAEWHIAKGNADEDKQIQVAKGMYGALDKKSEADFLAPLDDKLVWSDLAAPKDMSGKAEAKKFYLMFTKAFTDMKTTIDPIIAVDEYVVAETASSATHSGQFGPLKATKKPVVLHGVDVLVLKDGKVAAGTSYVNTMDLLAQEGLLPKPKAEAPPKADKAKEEKPKAGEDKEKPAGEKGDKDKGDKKPKAAETKPAADKEKK
jgi:steroid delta-isomerase-like uncharacterized protein